MNVDIIIDTFLVGESYIKVVKSYEIFRMYVLVLVLLGGTHSLGDRSATTITSTSTGYAGKRERLYLSTK